MRFLQHALLGVSMSILAVAADGPVQVIPRPEPPKWSEAKADADGRAWLSVGEKAAAEWELIDRAGATLDVPPGSTIAVFAATKPGAYRVVAVADGKLVRVIVQVGDVVPPKPPVPPGPPDPPQPVDALVEALSVAYVADTSTEKRTDLAQLTAVYLEAVKQAGRAEFTTASELLAAVRQVAAALIPEGRLAGVRKVISADLVKILPVDPDAPITDEIRTKASNAFARYAKALGEIAK